DKIKGSAVNPVLREGNSDRRAPKAVKNYAKKNPHSMGAWSEDSKSHVATMDHGDFKSNEKSLTITGNTKVQVQLVGEDGSTLILKENIGLISGEIIDASVMSKKALLAFLKEQIADARKTGVLFSLHMKATMMKVSDPIIFGYAVKAFFADVFKKYGDEFQKIGINANDGLENLLKGIKELPEGIGNQIKKDIQTDID